MNRVSYLLNCLFLLFIIPHVSARLIFVPDEAASIQAAINIADPDDEIVVRDGVYQGEGFRDIRFYGREITVRSENGKAACVITGTDGFRAFVFDNNETTRSILKGFTIKEFVAPVSDSGGAVFIQNAAATLMDCEFRQNESDGDGGAISIIEASDSITISDCTFIRNGSWSTGGALAITQSSDPVFVSDCTFTDNTGRTSGGAVFIWESMIDFYSNVFVGNTGCFDGGAIGAWKGTGVINDCVFNLNLNDSEICFLDTYGGAIGAWSSSFAISNCLFINNVARGFLRWPQSWEAYGGAVYLDNYGQAVPNSMINCTVYENRVEVQGDGGGVYGVHDIELRSSILWKNIKSWNFKASNFLGANADVRYCIIQGGFPGEGNSEFYPQFNMPEIDYFYLLPSSSGIDTGHALASDVCFSTFQGEVCLDALTTSPDGTLDTGTVDRGYHYRDACPVDPTATPTPTSTPRPCEEFGVKIRMPAEIFRAGDLCWCRVDVCNDQMEPLVGHPLFVILDVYGSLYFAPSFEEFDHYLDNWPQFASGTTEIEVLAVFAWPEATGSATGIYWYAALTNPAITQIVGTWDIFSFGWTDIPLPTATPAPPTATPTVTPTQPPTPTGFILVPSGTYTRGSPVGEPCRSAFETEHTVILTRSFWMMGTEVSRKLWASLKSAQSDLPADPSDLAISPTMEHPVQKVTWHEAILFSNLMSIEFGLTRCYYLDPGFTEPVDAGNYMTVFFHCNFDANGFRLPTEAEWEYACRAGTTRAFSCDEPEYTTMTCSSCDFGVLPTLEQYCVFCANAPGGSAAVGSKSMNDWGLYDMLGNVREWCWDWEDQVYPSGTVTDPTGAPSGVSRVVRGGSWDYQPQYCRSAGRGSNMPDNGYKLLGFRLVRSSQ